MSVINLDDHEFITTTGVMAMLDLSKRQVERLMADPENPIPIYQQGKTGPGNAHKFRIRDVHQWDIHRKISGLTVGDNGEVYDYESERARLTFEQANQKKRENALAEREVVPMELLALVLERDSEHAASLADGMVANIKRGLPHIEMRDLELIQGEVIKLRNSLADLELKESDFDALEG